MDEARSDRVSKDGTENDPENQVSFARTAEELWLAVFRGMEESKLLTGMLAQLLLEAHGEWEGSRTEARIPLRKKIETIDERTLKHTARLEQLEAHVESFRTEGREVPRSPDFRGFVGADFEEVQENLKSLLDAGEDKASVLYHMMELETLLKKLEEKAGATSRKYESRLAATLRDVCWVQEPAELSKQQIEAFSGAVRALIDGWGKLNREKTSWIRARLLEVGLTWLPTTAKAGKDIAEARELMG